MSKEYPRIYRSSVDGEYHHQERSGHFEAAGIWDPGDISSIEALTVLDEVLGLARPLYNLRQLCRVIRMDTLETTIDIGTVLSGQEKVPALVEAELSAEAYTPVSFDLWKNVTHVAFADESLKKSRVDLMGLHTEDAARDLSRMENKQIDEAIDAATGASAAGKWDAMTTAPTNDTDPFVSIMIGMIDIEGKGYRPTKAACHPTVWGAFIRNSYVARMVDAGLATIGPTGGRVALPGFPAVEIITDYAMLATSFWLLDDSAPALILGEGPTEAEKYRNPAAGFDAYIIRQYLEPQIVLADAIYEIDTVL